MDGREGMALSNSAPYYLHHSASGFRNLPNPGVSVHQVQPNFRGNTVNTVGSSTFNVEGSPASFPSHGFTVTVASPPVAGGGGTGGGGSLSGGEVVKKKRGRPRKYGPDGSGAGTGTVSLGLSPLSSPNSSTPAERRKRGRPPGSGRKQRLASVGEWMSSSAGVAFTPHVIYVVAGEDIASKILSFSLQRQRSLCILSATGSVSAVTLRLPASSVGSVTYEGSYEILCLSGSYLVAETGGSQNRTGGINVSLASADGRVIGGSVAGRLIASRPVQVVVCSFAHGNQKPVAPKPKTDSEPKLEKIPPEQAQCSTNNAGQGHMNPPASQHVNPAGVGWAGGSGGRGLKADIDLMRG